jgi:hypothetical protein
MATPPKDTSPEERLKAWAWWGEKLRGVINRRRLARGEIHFLAPRRAVGQAAGGPPRRGGEAINDARWLHDEVIATGALKQRLLGRSKLVPGEFVLAATESRVVAFEARGRREPPFFYWIRILPGEKGSWHRTSVRITDLDAGRESEKATLEIGGERIAVKRLYDKDAGTDEFFELLGR